MNYSYTLLYTLRRCISVQLETPNARCYYMIILLYFFTFYPRIYTHSLPQLTIINCNTTTTQHTMAKSLRSKVKQAAGRKRRSDSHYAVAEAARIQRLSDKLLAKSESDKEAKAAEVPVAEEGDDAEMKEG